MNNIKIGNYRRVTKATARKLYNAGKTIQICGHKIAINGYMGGCVLSGVGDFDAIVNCFIYYNCNYESGYYPAFYICE